MLWCPVLIASVEDHKRSRAAPARAWLTPMGNCMPATDEHLACFSLKIKGVGFCKYLAL